MKDRRIHSKTLEEYVDDLVKRERDKRYNILKNVYSNIMAGEIILVDPNPPKDFLEYLRRPDYALWLWTTVALTLATVATVVLTSVAPRIIYLRYVLGSIAVLFLPGYASVEALYPKEQDLSPLERLALSIGLSLAITPLIGLLLNYTPWGIRLEPVLTSLTIYTITIAIAASYRKYQNLKTRL